MNYLKVNATAKRNDTGARVRVVDVRPVGGRVFYQVEDLKDGHTVIVGHEDLRPVAKCDRCGAEKPEGQSCGCFDNGCQ